MDEQNTATQARSVALPAYLLKRMQAFRIGKADRQSYVVRDKLQGKSYDFEPWQFFVLEVLPGCEDLAKLSTIFEDRFGYPLPHAELNQLFASLADAGLFNEDAASHPLLAQFGKKSYAVEDGQAKVKSFRAAVVDGRHVSGVVPAPAGAAQAPAGGGRPQVEPTKAPAAEETLPAGLQDVVGFDPRAVRKMWVLLDPRPLLKLLAPLLRPLKYGLYALPLLAFAALYLSIRYSYLIQQDTARLVPNTTLLEHALYSLLTVNLLATFTTAVVAHTFRATVSGVGIAVLMSFLPRFTTRISHVEQLSRNERMWLHAAPLLLRLTLFSVSVLTWYATRHNNVVIAQVALTVGAISLTGLLISANPLIKSSGYHLLAAFANEPHLRGKAFRMLLNKMRGGTFREAEDLLLATYGAASAGFMFVMIVGAVLILGVGLQQLHVGGSAVIVLTLLGVLLVQRAFRYFGRVEAAYERSLQFDRWRKRVLPAETSEEAAAKRSSGFASYVWRALPLSLLALMFLPYSYNPGGPFKIFPSLQQVITTDVSGVVKEVYFDGGETLKKGTVVARLASADNQAQVDIYAAKMNEQQALVDDLKSRPRPEDVALAARDLQVQQTRAHFSKITLERVEKLHAGDAASREEVDDALREHQVNLSQVAEKRAALQVAKLGATPDEIAAAQAKWQALKSEHDSYLDKVKRSSLLMPADGKLLTLHLQQKANAYYKGGEPFAAAENTGQVTVEIELPESDVEFVAVNSSVQVRPTAYSTQLFVGKVRTLDWNVTERPFGNVIKVIAVIDNADSRLRNGMTGYAKVEGPTLPVWKAFSLAVLRFFNVEVWSWIP